MHESWHQEIFTKITCQECGSGLDLKYGSCKCGHYSIFENIISSNMRGDPEMVCRDKQAAGYVGHSKFPTQIGSFQNWMSYAIKLNEHAKILELGSGPGPFTAILSNEKCRVLAVDFSRESLRINKRSCEIGRCVFLQQDLNKIIFPNVAFDAVVMADFIQHLGGRTQREILLSKAIEVLKPGGVFYLTFFNLNIKHYIRGDVHGGYSSGQIRYERLTPKNVIDSLPATAKVLSVRPMNIVNSSYWIDRSLSYLPGMKFLGRMIEITGVKNVC